jgi:hypothetical protein
MADVKSVGMKPVEVVIIAALVGAVAFFGGMKYSDMQRTNQRGNAMRQFQNGQGGPNGASGFRGNRTGGRPVVGEVVSVDATTMTVKLADGTSKIVVLSETTTVSATATAAKTDIKVGSKVGAFGTDNADGSLTAQSVQLNPSFTGGMMGGVGGRGMMGATGSSQTR